MRVRENSAVLKGGLFRWPGLIAGFFIFLFFFFALPVHAKVVINEVMFDPEGTDDNEWVELYNNGDEKVDLTGWDLDPDGDSYQDLTGKEIEAEDYLLIEGLSKMRNSHGQVALYNSDEHTAENLVDYVQYGEWDLGDTENKVRDRAIGADLWEEDDFVAQIKENYSIERKKDGEDDDDSDDWQLSYKKGGTPGKKNTNPDDFPPVVYSSDIRINEILPNPEEDENEEYIEFYNFGHDKSDLAGWILRDASKSGKCELPSGSDISVLGYLVIYKKDCKISLNNSGGETVTLYSPDEKKVSSVTYQSAKEGVSYNYSQDGYRWSKFLTPGKENIFNNLPSVKVDEPKKVIKNVYADFSVKAKDGDRDKLKYTWDFGDGHKSYKRETRHKYEKTGKFRVKIKVTDGSEDVIKEFSVKVEKMKRYDVEIIAFSANPKGKDTLGEWVEVKNSSSKKINLIHWSIATGWKNPYNHPISEKFYLKPGEIRQVSREISKFTLANTKSKIELRYPDGKKADEVEYDREGDSIKEDEIYRKTEKGWAWENTGKENKPSLPPKDEQPPSVPELIPEENILPENPESDMKENEEGEVLGIKDENNPENSDKLKGKWYYRAWTVINIGINKILNYFQ